LNKLRWKGVRAAMSETKTDLIDLLSPVVDKIRKQCTRTDDGHLVYSGEHANIKYIPLATVNRKRYSLSTVMFAFHSGLPNLDLAKLRKLCKMSLCLEPTHYCLLKDFNCEENLDANGWNQYHHEYLKWTLGLLPNALNDRDCVLYPGSRMINGYGERLWLNNDRIFPHVAALRLKLGRPLKDKMQSSHLCGNPACVNPYHLAEETGQSNNRRNKTAKLKEQEVKEIATLLAKRTHSQVDIGKQYGVSGGMVGLISTGQNHSEISGIAPRQKPKRHEIEITEKKMHEIVKRLEICSRVADPVTREIHWIPKSKPDKGGYVKTSIFGFDTRYHVLGAILQSKLNRFPDRSKDEYALHRCRRRDCCAPHHMYIGTAKQNAADTKQDGMHRNSGKIDLETAKQIREANGTKLEIAKKFQVSLPIVHHIKVGDTWVE
jgi:hypothetical protein